MWGWTRGGCPYARHVDAHTGAPKRTHTIAFAQMRAKIIIINYYVVIYGTVDIWIRMNSKRFDFVGGRREKFREKCR